MGLCPGVVLLSSLSGSPRHSGSIPITPLRLGFLNFTQGYFGRFLVNVKTSLCSIKVNAGWFPDLLVPKQMGLIKPFVIQPDPLVSPWAPINACGGARLKINLEAFGKQQLIEGHMLPITCWGGETWGKGLKPRSEAPVFRISCVGLCKYLHTTSKIQAVAKVLCQTPWKSKGFPGEEPAGKLGMLQLHFPPVWINSSFGWCSEGGPASMPCAEWVKMVRFHGNSSFAGFLLVWSLQLSPEWDFFLWAFTCS